MYALAKDIQILKPDIFGNIFLGLGPFHMEKIVIACLGKYLSIVGISHALIESYTYGKDITENKVMNGKHYVKGKEGMELITEAIAALMFEQLRLEQGNYDLDQQIERLEYLLQEITMYLDDKDLDGFKSAWGQSKIIQKDIRVLLENW